MAKWRPVDVRLWNDRKFLSLSEDGRMLWLFLLTAPCTLPIPGVIIAGEHALAEHLGWIPERLREGFHEIAKAGLSVRIEGRLVWLCNALKYQPPAGPNTIKSWAKTWDDVPECDLKVDLWEALKIACKSWSQLFAKGFAKPFADGSAKASRNSYTQDQEQDQEQKQDQDQEQEREEGRTQTPFIPERNPQVGAIANRVWSHAAVLHSALKLENIDPQAPPWPALATGQHPGWKSLLDRVGEQLVETKSEVEAEVVCMRRVDVAAAEARAKGTRRWFNPSSMFSANSFAIGASMTPEQITRKGPKSAFEQIMDRAARLEAEERERGEIE